MDKKWHLHVGDTFLTEITAGDEFVARNKSARFLAGYYSTATRERFAQIVLRATLTEVVI